MLYSSATPFCTNEETEAQRIKQLAQEVSVLGFKVQFGSMFFMKPLNVLPSLPGS